MTAIMNRSRDGPRYNSRGKKPPMMVLTPDVVPEFVIPRSPSVQSSSASESEWSLTPRLQQPSLFHHLSVPENADAVHRRSITTPSSPNRSISIHSTTPTLSPEPPRHPQNRDTLWMSGQRHLNGDSKTYSNELLDTGYAAEDNRWYPDYYSARNGHSSPEILPQSAEGQRRRLPPTPLKPCLTPQHPLVKAVKSASRRLPAEPIANEPRRSRSTCGRRLPDLPTPGISRGRLRKSSEQPQLRTRSPSAADDARHTPPALVIEDFLDKKSNQDDSANKITEADEKRQKFQQQCSSDLSMENYTASPSLYSGAEDSLASSLSPSVDQFTSKSGSEAEQEPISAIGAPNSSSFDNISVSDKRRTSSFSAVGSPSTNVSTSSSWGAHSEDEKRPTGLGLVHFCIQYFPVRKRLRVSVMKAEGLAGKLRPDLELHALVKIALMPGKQQKQQSASVKRSRDAVFNEEFFFDNVTLEDIKVRSVSIRVCHHSGKQFHKDVVIGEIEVPLIEVPNLQSKKEVRLQQILKPRLNVKKLGKLQVSTCLEREARRLTINVFKADDLPKFGISGPPDPCVKISVDQLGKVQTKQTRTLKSCCNAVYKEAVMFLVSCKESHIAATKITIMVIDTKRTSSGDDLIGQAFLGQSAADKTEIDQWINTIGNPGKEYKATHVLKPPSDDNTVNH